jgi:hypothetical protein
VAITAESLSFTEQEAFFRRKLNLPTQGWTDIYTQEHDWAFVVAGANRDDLVADFRTAVQKAIDGGSTLEDFRKDFDRIVAKHGWDYNGGRNWRSRVIYETNLRSSYMAGRHEQLMAVREQRPYWQYIHSDAVEHPRPQHEAWNGMVLRWDDPWWQQHFPPNGWGCQCSIRALSERDLQRLGKSGPDKAPEVVMETHTIGQRSPNGPRVVQVPQGVDPGFEYTPGRSRLSAAIPPPDKPPAHISGATSGPGVSNRLPDEPLPTARPSPVPLLDLADIPASEQPAAMAKAFLEPFGATLDEPVIFTDAVGERVVIGNELFTKGGRDVLSKIDKQGRGKYMAMLAEALRDPDEIWVRLEWYYREKVAVVRRRYVTRFVVDGHDQPLLAVFERGDNGWTGTTTFQMITDEQDVRVGVRLYRREE